MRKLLLLLPIAALVLAACQRPADELKSSTSGTPTAGQKLKIVFIPKNSGNPYFDQVSAGFEEAAKAAGCEFTTVAPAKGDATSQIPIIKEQIQRKVDVIALSANSPDALNVVLDEAKAAGILVVTVDSDLTRNESHREACVLSPDAKQIGESQVELLGSQIGYEGDIAILSATHDAPNQNAWIAVMQEALKQPKYAKMKLVDTVYGDDQPEKSATEFEALLSKHSNLRGVISPTSVGLAAAAQALETSGKFPGGPKASGAGLFLTGLSTPNQLKKFVEGGVIQAFQLWSPRDMGVLCCNVAIAIKQGKLTPGDGVEFDDPKLGKQKFGTNNVINISPLTTFDKSNIANFDF
ncbi:MAG: substrate-binding domain-containing protein [Fimbriimonadaceae bacterium]|nr:substrate-binding domain-containing protein [Fimbriimonadaceae bacterium]